MCVCVVCMCAGFYCRMIFKRCDKTDDLLRCINGPFLPLAYKHKHSPGVSLHPPRSLFCLFYDFHKSDVC